MILQALVHCYEALAERGELEKPGWSPVKVSWGLELDADGQVKSLLAMGGTDAKGKQIPRTMKLPDPVKRSSGVAANFLCDNSAYVLGVDAKGKPERTRECFAACARKHQAILKDVRHPTAKAILNFFEIWKPENAAQHPAIQPNLDMLLKGGNIVFVTQDADGEPQLAQDVPEIRRAWDEAYAKSDDAVMGRCLVTGEEGPIAILHPSIKGVMGAQSSGASLVSFNAPAFESYGKESARDNQGQGRNAPVGRYAAFAYGAALNYMVGQAEFPRKAGRHDARLLGGRRRTGLRQRVHGDDGYGRRGEKRNHAEGTERRADRALSGTHRELGQRAAEPEKPILYSGTCAECVQIIRAIFPAGFLRRICRALSEASGAAEHRPSRV